MKNRVLRSKIVELFDTQGEFAKMINLDQSTLSRIIRGQRTPTYEQMILLVNVLKTPKERLFNHEQTI